MAAMINPPEWPEYQPDEPAASMAWREYCMMPDHIPSRTTPWDTPLPFDRTKGSRTHTHLFGKLGTHLIREGIKFVGECRPSSIFCGYEMEAKLGVAGSGFDYLNRTVQKHLTGHRPFPIYARSFINTPKFPALGDGYFGAVYAGIHDGRWSPLVEITYWSDSEVIFHRLVPARLIAGEENSPHHSRLYIMIQWQASQVRYPKMEFFS